MKAARPAWLNKNNIGKTALALWFIATLVGLGSLMLSHVVAMPAPEDLARLKSALAAVRDAPDRPLLLHVIYRDCSCTNSLFDHLVKRRPFDDADEVVLFVGEDPNKLRAAEEAGFRFSLVTSAELRAELGIEAAPVLIVSDAGGRLRYIGGYYNHPAAIHPLDEKIYLALTAGEEVKALPVFGCAVSDRLQAALDPFGLVY